MIVALAGGVGGARLAAGLAGFLGSELTVIVNTGDDFEYLGLSIAPDLDTVMYTLAGVANPATGWGMADERWTFMDQLGRLDVPDWFMLGDRDLATHVLRTKWLLEGQRLTEVTAALCARFGIEANIHPMCDAPVRTMVRTREGELAFQEYFVRRRCEIAVTGFDFRGAGEAHLSPEVDAALSSPELEAIVICPSNPFVSIDPILSVPGLQSRLQAARIPVIAVTPIIAGKAVKGPAAKIMAELQMEPAASTVAAHYRGLIDGFVLDTVDEAESAAISDMGIKVLVTDTLMQSPSDRARLAGTCIEFARMLPT